jgi:hypothetical protein
MRRLVALLAALAGAALVLVACSSSTTHAPATQAGSTSTVVGTHTPSPRLYTPAPAATVKPLPYGARAPKGERDARCPYIKTGLNQDDDYSGDVNLANLEGDRVYRTTLLTRYHPIGCRFYFYAPPYEAVADIRPYTFATATDAYNAMVRTAEAGREPIVEKDFVGKLTGISFRTKYFGPDGFHDWAFVFAKGRRMVVVYTQRSDTSRNALYIAQAIAAKF